MIDECAWRMPERIARVNAAAAAVDVVTEVGAVEEVDNTSSSSSSSQTINSSSSSRPEVTSNKVIKHDYMRRPATPLTTRATQDFRWVKIHMTVYIYIE